MQTTIHVKFGLVVLGLVSLLCIEPALSQGRWVVRISKEGPNGGTLAPCQITRENKQPIQDFRYPKKVGTNWNANNWSMSAHVSGEEGLVLEEVRLKSRYMAKKMAVPSYDYSFKPVGKNNVVQYKNNRLSISDALKTPKFARRSDGSYHIGTSYVHPISCVTINQNYEFFQPNRWNEPSRRFMASQLTPKTDFIYRPLAGEDPKTFQIRIKSVHEYRPSPGWNPQMPKARNLMADAWNFTGVLTSNSPPISSIVENTWNLGQYYRAHSHWEDDPELMLTAGPFWTPVKNGQMVDLVDVPDFPKYPNIPPLEGNRPYVKLRNPDNLHITYKSSVQLPKNVGIPGCPECLHMHWNWTWLKSPGSIKGHPHFTKHPHIVEDSNQDIIVGSHNKLDFVYVGVGRYNPNDKTVSSVGDTFFEHGLFFGPNGDKSDVLPWSSLLKWWE